MEKEYYQIGLFSKMNKVTIKTLRHYDDMNLLKPYYIDESTGYRYYTSSQIPDLHMIISMKQLGLSLDDIKQVQAGLVGINILKEKKRKLKEEISSLEMKVAQIEHYLASDEELLDSKYNVVIKTLPKVIVASYRTIIPNYNALFKTAPECGEEMLKLGCELIKPEYCFNIYHQGEYREFDIDVEMCNAVVEAKDETDIIKFKTMDEVKQAACVLHRGSYNNLRDAYAALIRWIEANNYEIIDNPRESYIDGIWNKDNIEDWLTEIQIPINEKRTP